MSPMKKPGTPPDGGKEVLEAWGIIQREDKSFDAYQRLRELWQQCPKEEQFKISSFIEAFTAYGGERVKP